MFVESVQEAQQYVGKQVKVKSAVEVAQRFQAVGLRSLAKYMDNVMKNFAGQLCTVVAIDSSADLHLRNGSTSHSYRFYLLNGKGKDCYLYLEDIETLVEDGCYTEDSFLVTKDGVSRKYTTLSNTLKSLKERFPKEEGYTVKKVTENIYL